MIILQTSLVREWFNLLKTMMLRAVDIAFLLLYDILRILPWENL